MKGLYQAESRREYCLYYSGYFFMKQAEEPLGDWLYWLFSGERERWDDELRDIIFKRKSS